MNIIFFVVGRRMVVARSNYSRTAVESQSNLSRIVVVKTHIHTDTQKYFIKDDASDMHDEKYRQHITNERLKFPNPPPQILHCGNASDGSPFPS